MSQSFSPNPEPHCSIQTAGKPASNHNIPAIDSLLTLQSAEMYVLTAKRYLILKRGFDIVFSLAVIIFILSWLYPLLMIIIKYTSNGSVIFKQKRTGKDNRSFTCYKFRSMHLNDASDHQQAVKNDARLTRIGKFMRKTNIDELPQFYNVLMGSMSVVGPRPHMIRHTEIYSKAIDTYMIRHLLKPGITGWAQVNGYRGETKEPGLMLKRIEHDIWYINNLSMKLDIRIISSTILNMVTNKDEVC